MNLTCHCGSVKIIVTEPPESLTSCNCSVCHRYGTLWGYYDPKNVNIETTTTGTNSYRWGDESLAFHRCAECGCVMYWAAVEKEKRDRMGINFRMAARREIESIPVRKFDGADTWEFIE